MLRLRVSDLQDDRTDPRLMMPSSRKGRNRKPGYKPVPISMRLAAFYVRRSLVGLRMILCLMRSPIVRLGFVKSQSSSVA